MPKVSYRITQSPMLVICSRGVPLSLHLRVLSSSTSAQAGMNCSIGHKARQSAVNILRPNTESSFAEQGDCPDTVRDTTFLLLPNRK